jgi:hypothetical protein
LLPVTITRSPSTITGGYGDNSQLVSLIYGGAEYRETDFW